MNLGNKHTTWEQLFFEYLEGNLRKEEMAIVDKAIQEDAGLKAEFDLWSAAYISEPVVSYPHKKALYRKPTGGIQRKTLLLVMFLFLLSGAGFYWMTNSSEQDFHTSVKQKEQNTVIMSEPESEHNTSQNKLTEQEIQPINTELAEIENAHAAVEVEEVHHLELEAGELIRPQHHIPLLIEREIVDQPSKTDTIQHQSIQAKKQNEKAPQKIYHKHKRPIKPIEWDDVKRAWKEGAKVVPME